MNAFFNAQAALNILSTCICSFWLQAKQMHMMVEPCVCVVFFLNPWSEVTHSGKKIYIFAAAGFLIPLPGSVLCLLQGQTNSGHFAFLTPTSKVRLKSCFPAKNVLPHRPWMQLFSTARNSLINAHCAQLGWCNTGVKWVFLLMDCLIMPKCWSKFGVIMVIIVTVHHNV